MKILYYIRILQIISIIFVIILGLSTIISLSSNIFKVRATYLTYVIIVFFIIPIMYFIFEIVKKLFNSSYKLTKESNFMIFSYVFFGILLCLLIILLFKLNLKNDLRIINIAIIACIFLPKAIVQLIKSK